MIRGDIPPDAKAELFPFAAPILIGYRGSLAHGTHIPPEQGGGTDDVDLMAVYVESLSYYFGLPRNPRGMDRKVGVYDTANYELTHFVSLLSNGNPNVLSLLWTKPEHMLLVSRVGEMLRGARALFAAKSVYSSFAGYASAQLHRMTAWHDQQAVGCKCAGKFHDDGCPLQAERGRGSSKLYATGFMGEKRKRLVEEHGFDCKNAAHLIRLLNMAVEFLRDGDLRVDRTGLDADELKAIKQGEWGLDRVMALADTLFADAKRARDASPLPERPDEEKIRVLLLDMLSFYHAGEAVMRKHRLDCERFFTPSET